VDTARCLLGVGDENDAGAVSKALLPWVGLARGGRSVIVTHHENKNAGKITGSTAWESEPDRLVHVKKEGDEYSRTRKVKSWGRGASDRRFEYELMPDDKNWTVNRVLRRHVSLARDVVLDAVTSQPQTTNGIA